MDTLALKAILGKSEAQLAFPAEHADRKSNDLGRVSSKHSLRLQSDCVGFVKGRLKGGKKKRCGVQAEQGWGPEQGLSLACGGVVSEW